MVILHAECCQVKTNQNSSSRKHPKNANQMWCGLFSLSLSLYLTSLPQKKCIATINKNDICTRTPTVLAIDDWPASSWMSWKNMAQKWCQLSCITNLCISAERCAEKMHHQQQQQPQWSEMSISEVNMHLNLCILQLILSNLNSVITLRI